MIRKRKGKKGEDGNVKEKNRKRERSKINRGGKEKRDK